LKTPAEDNRPSLIYLRRYLFAEQGIYNNRYFDIMNLLTNAVGYIVIASQNTVSEGKMPNYIPKNVTEESRICFTNTKSNKNLKNN